MDSNHADAPRPGLLFYLLHAKKIPKIKSGIQPVNTGPRMVTLVKIKAVCLSMHDSCLFI